jgi:hypothetical protein
MGCGFEHHFNNCGCHLCFMAAGFHFFQSPGLVYPYSAYYCSYPHNLVAADQRIGAFLIIPIPSLSFGA